MVNIYFSLGDSAIKIIGFSSNDNTSLTGDSVNDFVSPLESTAVDF